MDMSIKKLALIFIALMITLVHVNYVKTSDRIKKASEPVRFPAPEAISQVETEPIIEAVVEPIVETAPEDDRIYYDVPYDIETQQEIIKICSEYDMPYELILGVIYVESSFRSDVLGDGGNSFGLMQIQPRWWSKTMAREGVTDLLDPLQNIRCGCAILQELKNRYGTDYRALQAYNTGKPDTKNGYADKVYKYVGELTEVEI